MMNDGRDNNNKINKKIIFSFNCTCHAFGGGGGMAKQDSSIAITVIPFCCINQP
jgi:hypothetical protein